MNTGSFAGLCPACVEEETMIGVSGIDAATHDDLQRELHACQEAKARMEAAGDESSVQALAVEEEELLLEDTVSVLERY